MKSVIAVTTCNQMLQNINFSISVFYSDMRYLIQWVFKTVELCQEMTQTIYIYIYMREQSSLRYGKLGNGDDETLSTNNHHGKNRENKAQMKIIILSECTLKDIQI